MISTDETCLAAIRRGTRSGQLSREGSSTYQSNRLGQLQKSSAVWSENLGNSTAYMPDVRLRITVRGESIVPRMTGIPLLNSTAWLIGSAVCEDASGDSRGNRSWGVRHSNKTGSKDPWDFQNPRDLALP